MREKRFQKRVENFVCERCGEKTKGKGYTDHCPVCLWSKHVDVNPGDRKADCGGLMEPIGVEIKARDSIIHYRCTRCGFEHRVKAASDDNFDKIIELSKKPLQK